MENRELLLCIRMANLHAYEGRWELARVCLFRAWIASLGRTQ